MSCIIQGIGGTARRNGLLKRLLGLLGPAVHFQQSHKIDPRVGIARQPSSPVRLLSLLSSSLPLQKGSEMVVRCGDPSRSCLPVCILRLPVASTLPQQLGSEADVSLWLTPLASYPECTFAQTKRSEVLEK
jgi:hypothetical protein